MKIRVVPRYLGANPRDIWVVVCFMMEAWVRVENPGEWSTEYDEKDGKEVQC
jgi:hypothetical protein